MACALTQGYTYVGCKGGAGGIKEVLITEFANVTSYTVTSNVITAMTLATGKLFRRYVLDKEMGSFSDNATYSPASGTWTYEPTIDFTIKKLTTSVIAEIKLIAQNNLIMIVRDGSGATSASDVYRVFGVDRCMDLMSAGTESGTGMTDFAGNKLQFKGKETNFAYEISTSLIANLLVAAP